MDHLAEAVAGGAAGVFSVFVTYPLTVAKLRLQAQRRAEDKAKDSDPDFDGHHEHYRNAMDCLIKTLKHDGIRGLFSGVQSSLPRAFITNFIFYYVTTAIKPYLAKLRLNKILFSTLQGVLAGTVVQFIMTPAELVNTKLIVAKRKAGLDNSKSFFDTFFHVLKTESVLGLYKGIWAQLVLTINPGITTAVRHLLVPSGELASVSANFWAGAGSKSVASMLTYPIVVAKVRLFTEKPDNGLNGLTKSPSTISTLAEIFEENGFAGMYKGSELQVSNAIIKEALLNTVRHPINRFFHRLIANRAH